MDKTYHVFISSTFTDLEEERKKVSGAVSKAGYVAEGMELFPASSQQQLDFIKRIIDRCDYYVVILGGRYGSLADDNISYTEKEYEYALKKNIPVLAFLHKDIGQIPNSKTETKKANIARLENFRSRLSKSKMVDYWSNPDELATKVAVSLAQEVNLNPGIGWVRGDQAIDPKLIQELEDVRRERDKLIEANNTINNFSFPEWMPNITDKFEISYEFEISENNHNYIAVASQKGKIKTSWQEIFKKLGSDLYKGIHLHRLQSITSTNILSELTEAYIKENLVEEQSYNTSASISLSYEKIRDTLLGYNLVETKTRRYNNGSEYLSYEISNSGKKYLSYLNVGKPT